MTTFFLNILLQTFRRGFFFFFLILENPKESRECICITSCKLNSFEGRGKHRGLYNDYANKIFSEMTYGLQWKGQLFSLVLKQTFIHLYGDNIHSTLSCAAGHFLWNPSKITNAAGLRTHGFNTGALPFHGCL